MPTRCSWKERRTVADKTWKAFEREAAALFGTSRFIPQATNADRHACDAETEWEVIECKYRSAEPSAEQVRKWFTEVEKRAKKSGKSPVLCVRVKGRRGFVVWRKTEWMDEDSVGQCYARVLSSVPSQWYPRREATCPK